MRHKVYSEQHTRAGWNTQPSIKYNTQELVGRYHLWQSQSKVGKVKRFDWYLVKNNNEVLKFWLKATVREIWLLAICDVIITSRQS